MKIGMKMALMAAMMGGMGEDIYGKSSPDPVKAMPDNPKPVIPKGCREYFFASEFGKYSCVAMNQASANKKFEKWKKNQANP